MKLTDKPLLLGYSVVDSHSSFCPPKAKTRRSGFLRKPGELTDKPLSFGYSVVDSHSSFRSSKSKKPAEAGFYVNQVKLTDAAFFWV
ncbi:hypothetical protein [Escherichia coli]|uniref:hypothetical protein n=1 Tax=Escherichia coli TaxID=562 RepID=UPI002FCCBE0A